MRGVRIPWMRNSCDVACHVGGRSGIPSCSAASFAPDSTRRSGFARMPHLSTSCSQSCSRLSAFSCCGQVTWVTLLGGADRSCSPLLQHVVVHAKDTQSHCLARRCRSCGGSSLGYAPVSGSLLCCFPLVVTLRSSPVSAFGGGGGWSRIVKSCPPRYSLSSFLVVTCSFLGQSSSSFPGGQVPLPAGSSHPPAPVASPRLRTWCLPLLDASSLCLNGHACFRQSSPLFLVVRAYLSRSSSFSPPVRGQVVTFAATPSFSGDMRVLPP